MPVLQGINRKNSAGSLASARPQLVAYDLPTICRSLQAAPEGVATAAANSKQVYNFSALQSVGFLLIDEGLKLPLSLTTALQTAAMYEGMSWDEAFTRRYLAGEFFQQYLAFLFADTLRLLTTRQIGLNLALDNLVITAGRGRPVSLQLRRLSGTALLANSSDFEAVSSQPELYQGFVFGLLENNLRPLVEKLIEISGANRQVLWDFAIDAMLASLKPLNLDMPTRLSMLIGELDPSDWLEIPSSLAAYNPSFGSETGLIYLKHKCCKKFKKGERCYNCPGLAKRR